MSSRKLGLPALVAGAAMIWALPAASLGQGNEVDKLDQSTRESSQKLGAAVEKTLTETTEGVKRTTKKTRDGLRKAAKGGDKGEQKAQSRAPAADPQVQPPLRGDNPHGQGSVAVGDMNPSAERPFPDSTDDGVNSGEEVIAGRARGEEQPDGSFRGHITILELFGTELVGVNTVNGESKNGPLQPLQEGLDAICEGSMQMVCLQVLTANSATTATGSTNDFAVARAQLGGANGFGVGAAESQGNISEDPNCQTSTGSSSAADARFSNGSIADVTQSSSTSRACRGQAEQTTQTSSVVGLGGMGLPLPQPGCDNGVPDTRFSVLAPLATTVCNANEQGSSGARNALDVFALTVGGTSLVQESNAQSESRAVAPGEGGGGGPQCSDGIDNDGDGVIDAADPGCHTDGDPNNPATFDPNDNSEANAAPAANDDDGDSGAGGGSSDGDGDGDGDGAGGGGGGGSAAECSDGADNDGDGRIDIRDPGCHSDGNANNPDSYNPNDDSEADGARDLDSGSLAFTGTNVLGLTISGLLLLAGGLVLRRREGILPR